MIEGALRQLSILKVPEFLIEIPIIYQKTNRARVLLPYQPRNMSFFVDVQNGLEKPQ